MAGQPTPQPHIPERSAPNYETLVVQYQLTKDDLNKASDAELLQMLKQQIFYSDQLIGTWADCPAVVKDCKALRDSAAAELAKSKGDLILAYDYIFDIRSRLAQAFRSKSSESKKQVVGLSIWIGIAFAGCLAVLLVLKLLPGWTPRVAADSSNVAALFSAFLFGAIGGLFDAGAALSANYTQQTFDTGHWLWYLFSPFLGAILGTVVCGAILAGLLTTTGSGLQSTPSSPAAAATEPAASPTASETPEATSTATILAIPETPSPTPEAAENGNQSESNSVKEAFILLVAFIAGFKQIAVIGFIERLAASIFGGSAQPAKS